MRFVLLLLFSLSIVQGINAQVTLDPSSDSANSADITIEVDQSKSKNEGKSLALALAFSAVLPGSGEYYLQEKGRGKTFLLAETAFWASLYLAWVSKESYLQSARNYASEYAGIDASQKGEGFLELMGSYRSYLEKQHRQDSYELAQELSGKVPNEFEFAAIPENYWDFGSSNTPENTRHWNVYQRTLRYYRSSKVAVSFAIGALALNRLASMVSTLNVYKHTSSKTVGFELTPEIGPESTGARLSLNF